MEVRALVLTYHNGLRQPGDVFEFDDKIYELNGKKLGEGLEEVNVRTNKAAKASAAAMVKAAQDKATALRSEAKAANEKLQANPGDSALASAAITADDAARDAEREAAALADDGDMA